jgi:hypothetical protein
MTHPANVTDGCPAGVVNRQDRDVISHAEFVRVGRDVAVATLKPYTGIAAEISREAPVL